YPRDMVFFTTPDLLEIGGLPFTTPYEKPTRMEALRYYRRVVDTLDLAVQLHERVEAIDRKGASSFTVRTRRGDGSEQVYESRFVVVATGYFDNPNRLGIPGEDLPHVSHFYTEAHPYFRKQVVVVGGKNSAAEAALDLFRSGARVTLVHRRAELGSSIKYWVRPDIENRIREGSIAARFDTRVVAIGPSSAMVDSGGGREEIPADAVLLLTGFHPDVELLRRAGVRVDEETLAPEHDPETFETNVPGLFLAGSVAAGKETNRIFIENGRFHGQAIVRAIGGRSPY
ncbi:MAG: YpdA family putative bacillithiol disulfide reductase, partial [Acidobacteria bacterium]|nr:YpdA family putative bacillithiol disulfide reductase [Acidobacteriota bacterium]